MTPKEKITTILKESGDVVSGEVLSARLGISRVSIWKHIQGLVRQGTPIETTPNGYRLPPDPDSLMPWAFGARQAQIHYFPETTSTMDEAVNLARQGCPDFTVAVAERQTHGRGRMQRTWLSADGGLFFTVVIKPAAMPLMQAGLVNLAAAIDMAAVMREIHKVDARLKWPNDILVGQQKICGILSQMNTEGDHVDHMAIGIGLNVNNAPETEEAVAISLKGLLGRPVPRREILLAFLERFETRIAAFDAEKVIGQWRESNATLGQRVCVFTFKEKVEGTAVDLDAQGGLILQQDDGTRQTVIYGDCFHR
ncbi:biotin--[acetyl-CoA-carboxylase] ligase [Desulfosarcina ovata]|uniref:Bifunctional ligase/repressor BirA n=1 Tax=Desulfosarcina ovata subsp. ovata TaxID=2752305 RepID=A0A5K8A6U6_9BACT|nr:biotin--[acetyl-CoA-carboxylase] ligase [Desulfosarcina ovata]BBO88199.1 bifunctional biotin--[acetyl-CoA-carboxylase] synthetase/biotin operon repressor [Desulfosarcina ovata subsp. ovata]